MDRAGVAGFQWNQTDSAGGSDDGFDFAGGVCA